MLFIIWQDSEITNSIQRLKLLHLLTSFVYVIFIFFLIQRVKARAIPCPHQPPSRGDNSFGSSRRYCHPWRYQAAFATGHVYMFQGKIYFAYKCLKCI